MLLLYPDALIVLHLLLVRAESHVVMNWRFQGKGFSTTTETRVPSLLQPGHPMLPRSSDIRVFCTCTSGDLRALQEDSARTLQSATDAHAQAMDQLQMDLAEAKKAHSDAGNQNIGLQASLAAMRARIEEADLKEQTSRGVCSGRGVQ